MNTENNDLRCSANEIILHFHKQQELGQIQLLHMACSLALKDLDKAAFRETIKSHLAATHATEADVTDEDMHDVENKVGYGVDAWDCADPKDIIATAWNVLNRKRNNQLVASAADGDEGRVLPQT